MGLFTSRLSKLYQPKTDSEKFVGQFDWETWKQLTGWSDIDSEDYIPDVISIEQLKTKLKKTEYPVYYFCCRVVRRFPLCRSNIDTFV